MHPARPRARREVLEAPREGRRRHRGVEVGVFARDVEEGGGGGREGLVFVEGLGEDLAAVPEPEDVPVVAVGCALLCDGGWEDVACAGGGLEELVFDADVPIHVVFHDEGGGPAVFDDPGG